MKRNKISPLSILAVALIVLAVPVTLVLLNQNQSMQQEATVTPAECDVNGDGTVDAQTDLDAFYACWGDGSSPSCTTEMRQRVDWNRDGVVNVFDVSGWSVSCFPKPVCGDKVCSVGETIYTCKQDCYSQSPTPTPAITRDFTCGNGICEPNETLKSCKIDCYKR